MTLPWKAAKIRDWRFDPAEQELSRGKERVRLHTTEANLLTTLIDIFDKLPRPKNDKILILAWGNDTFVAPGSLHTSVGKLRNALGRNRKYYIDSRPYHLTKRPKLIAAKENPHEQLAPGVLNITIVSPDVHGTALVDGKMPYRYTEGKHASAQLSSLITPQAKRADTGSNEASKNLPRAIWFEPDSKRLLFRPSKHIPISETDLATNFGRLRRIQVPQAALDEASATRPELLMDRDIYNFLRDVWSSVKRYPSLIPSSPALKEWAQQIWAPPSRGSENLERKQLYKFVHAMNVLESRTELLPWFSYDDVSCWRVFVQVFPESILLLEQVSGNKKLPSKQRMAISLLCSTLATTDDERLASRAAAVAARLRDEVSTSIVHSYHEYCLVRQFLFTAVEAGEFPPPKMVDFLHRHAATKWEFRLNREYYKDRTDEAFARSSIRKFERPLPRDINAKPLSQYHRELLPKNLIDKAYKQLRFAS